MHILGVVQRVFVLSCRRKEEKFFVRLRLLIKTSLCSKVLLPVLMSIKKPKSLCLDVCVCECGGVKEPEGARPCVCVHCIIVCVQV